MNTRNHHSSHKKPRRQKDREIARLKSELAAERSRSAKLERQVTALKRELKDSDLARADQPLLRARQRRKSKAPKDRLLLNTGRHVRYYRKSSFFRYLIDSFRESAFMRYVTKAKRYLKRVQLLQTLIPILLAVGAMVAVAIVSPLALLILSVAIITPIALVILSFRRANRTLQRELADRRIRIMIPPCKGALAPHTFFIRNARAMAAEEGVTVIVVTPYTVSGRGLGGRGRFFTARREAENLYVVRRHYFFTLRRRVLDRLDGEITVVY